MKSAAMATDEIKSVLFTPHFSADFIAQRFHPQSGFNPSVRTDLVEKAYGTLLGFCKAICTDFIAYALQKPSVTVQK
jgi:hypothetical protein